jgi:hypothetical protein
MGFGMRPQTEPACFGIVGHSLEVPANRGRVDDNGGSGDFVEHRDAILTAATDTRHANSIAQLTGAQLFGQPSSAPYPSGGSEWNWRPPPGDIAEC